MVRHYPHIAWRWSIIIAVIALSLAVLAWLPPIPQPLSYHQFADQRTWLALPNAWNVLSNVAFLLAGVYGLWLVLTQPLPQAYREQSEKIAFIIAFIGTVLVAFGSSYYHLEPGNARLLWDRLPIAIVQAAVFSIILADRVNPKAGRLILYPMILLGILSAIYWEYTEQLGRGDIRFYAWVETVPVLIIVLLMVLFPSRYQGNRYLLATLLLYALGRIAEALDKPIYSLTDHVISGHSLKHLAIGASLWSLALYWRYRRLKQQA